MAVFNAVIPCYKRESIISISATGGYAFHENISGFPTQAPPERSRLGVALRRSLVAEASQVGNDRKYSVPPDG